ncbi:MAG: hypothetical protein IK137_03240 [Bacilli bacterium]|nr:hypothetical protein [Bacilli bacterium]
MNKVNKIYTKLTNYVLKRKEQNPEPQPEKKDDFEKLNLSQLCDQVEISRQKRKELYKKAKEEEINKCTEELARLFYENIRELLKEEIIGDYSNNIKGFGKYGTPSKVSRYLDDEKFKIVYDFSDSYNPEDVRKTIQRLSPINNNYIPHYPRYFAYGHSQDISWEYLERILEKLNIKISREYEKKSETNYAGKEIERVTDIITVIFIRQKDKDKTPVEVTGPQKIKIAK